MSYTLYSIIVFFYKIKGRVLVEGDCDPEKVANTPLGVSYVSIESENGEIGYGTKLVLRNGTFKRLIQGRIKDGDKLDGYGKMFYNVEKTLYYVGEWVDGKRQGRGVFHGTSYHYTGEFVNDRMSGFGKITWPDGAYYEGQLKSAKFSGNGKYVDADGNEYVGAYSDHLRNGRGTYKGINGDIYEGTWKDGKKLTGTLTRTKYNNCIAKYKDGDVDDDPSSLYCLKT